MADHGGFSATYRHGVPWGTLRIEGLGTAGEIPEIDYSESYGAHGEGCLTLAVAPAEVAVEVTVTTGGTPVDQLIAFAGSLSAPDGVLEIGDLVGDVFAYRFRVPSGMIDVVVSVDVIEEATKVGISVPALIGGAP